VINYLKNRRIRPGALGPGPFGKGFRDEEWRRFVDDMSIGMPIGRFPVYHQPQAPAPDPVPSADAEVPEPTDDEIAARLGRIAL